MIMLGQVIDFRGKNGTTWINGNNVNTSVNEFGFHAYITNKNSCYEVDPSTLGMYTGINDKHGNKIYSGDIIQWWVKHTYMYEDGIKEYMFTDLKGKVEYNTQLAAFTVKVGTIIEPIYLGNINKKSNIEFDFDTIENDIYKQKYKDDYINYKGIEIIGNIIDYKDKL